MLPAIETVWAATKAGNNNATKALNAPE